MANLFQATMGDNRLHGKAYGMEEDIYSIGCVVRQLCTDDNPCQTFDTLDAFRLYAIVTSELEQYWALQLLVHTPYPN